MSSEETQIAPETTIELSGGAPTPDQVDALVELAHAAEEADANPPFSEQTLVELHKAADSGAMDAPLRVAYAWAAPDEGSTDHQYLLAGAGVVVLGGEGSPDVLELVVRPNCRQHGIGGQLATTLADDVLAPQPGRIQRAWAHGEHDAAALLAVRHGWAPVRELWRMRLTSLDEIPSPRLPETVTIRPFEPGRDEQAWLRANAAAFADHPEQGRLTREDLDARMAEDWFDPAGFLLAEEGGQLLGFHWTKVHPGEDGGSEPLGEVYVVGVVPDAQGRGLGYSLTLAGIEHLRSEGLGAIMLYVDSDNTAAVELYRRLGFTRWDVDTMYAPVTEPGAEPA
ncbi:mycothiol synthase [Nesterenkonia sp. HG001]|uniref:mycothiol synthase n=1 Tax=Nesterenkonia sp. HG001 TaxID=2983207 RepID=UPI002AC6D004|nr:mycothiol synthase [Nesterenkonia sp. HG001]MDZ5076497.1 mycothiol synthase [Nesterenkonia sp. HG001]